MDGEKFDDLVKRLTAARLTRLDALRGLIASTVVGLTGATLAAPETEAKQHGKAAGKKGGAKKHGKAVGKNGGAKKAKAAGKQKGHGKHDHQAAVTPTTTPPPPCSPKQGAKQPNGCPCKGNGNCQTHICCVTAGGGPGTCCSGVATTTTVAPTTTTTLPVTTTTLPVTTTTTVVP